MHCIHSNAVDKDFIGNKHTHHEICIQISMLYMAAIFEDNSVILVAGVTLQRRKMKNLYCMSV